MSPRRLRDPLVFDTFADGVKACQKLGKKILFVTREPVECDTPYGEAWSQTGGVWEVWPGGRCVFHYPLRALPGLDAKPVFPAARS